MKKILVVFLAVVMSQSFVTYAQSDIEIFGFYQVRLSKEEGLYSLKGTLPASLGGATMQLSGDEQNQLSPAVQQLNLMFRKEFSSKVSTFLNFEMINNFSTEKGWGAFNLEEVWLNYEYTSNHSIKGGLLIPKFNSLNEIKNKMPLLPYIFRPLAYEPTLRAIVNPSDFLPERAFVQLQGRFFAEDLELNYAAFAGASESDYILSNTEEGATGSGTDTTNFKLFGGRIGINYDNLRAGVSTSFDKDNHQATLQEDVKRTRLGFDIGYSIFGFTIDAEYIKVMLDPKNTDKDLNKLFYYGTLAYDFTDQIFAYGTYSYLENK
ncbi:MAG: hypothetical protein R6W90_08985, partial [Ignavibacteriaceae bacterium]